MTQQDRSNQIKIEPIELLREKLANRWKCDKIARIFVKHNNVDDHI